MDSNAKPFLFYGYDLSKWKKSSILLFLAIAHITCAIMFGLLQERVFRIPGFKFGGYMTIVTSATYVVCGALEMWLSGQFKFSGGLLNYGILALTTFSGMYFTNWSLEFISFPARIIFKSSKVLFLTKSKLQNFNKKANSSYARFFDFGEKVDNKRIFK
ncbi:hypothetical protein MHBO_003453 [Bonamia ostreae]|uniref:Uncharacterized protein n=1 Tax=Bonamia ostreae TaxID=126728 RepID=A0ABV2AQH8_9EUKA